MVTTPRTLLNTPEGDRRIECDDRLLVRIDGDPTHALGLDATDKPLSISLPGTQGFLPSVNQQRAPLGTRWNNDSAFRFHRAMARPHHDDDTTGGHPGGSPHTDTSGHPGTSSTGGHPGGRDYSTAPLIVTWETTQACGLSCDHCRAEATPDRHPDELTTEEATALFEEIASFDPQPILVLSGGDPLERPDLFELLETAVDIGVTPSVTPATTSALTHEVIDRFAEIGVGRMAVSLDGASARAHDGFRGEEGTFETAIDAAKYAREVGLSIQVNTTVTAETVDELPKIADRAARLDAAMWEVFFLVPIGRGEELAQLSPERTHEVMEWLYRRSQSAPYRVITVEAPFYRRVARRIADEEGIGSGRVGSTGAGNGFVFVSHIGEVYPSGFLPESAGNVREQSLPELYQDAPIMEALRDRTSFEGPCGNCPMTETCGGSRSRAYAVTGSPFASDPLCPWAQTGETGASRTR